MVSRSFLLVVPLWPFVVAAVGASRTLQAPEFIVLMHQAACSIDSMSCHICTVGMKHETKQHTREEQRAEQQLVLAEIIRSSIKQARKIMK
jgi:hypothetical protein